MSARPARRVFPFAVALAAALGVTVRAQQPTFTSRVEAVRVDVLVTENGHPVNGLQPSDFEIFDNGVSQHIEMGSFEQLPLNVILALDTSQSVAGNRLRDLVEASRALIDGLKGEDRAGLLTFNHDLQLRAPLGTDLTRVRSAVGRVVGSGATALFDATYTALALGTADTGRSLVVLFSDGEDTGSWLKPASVLRAAGRSEVVFYTVRADDAPASFLQSIASATGGRVVTAGGSEDLKSLFVTILDEFKQRYLLSYYPAGVSGPGWHRLQVRVKGRKVSVLARPGYEVD